MSRLRTREAAKYLGVQPRTLDDWRCSGAGPRFYRLSARCVVYDTEELDRFLASKLRTSTSDADTAEEPRRAGNA